MTSTTHCVICFELATNHGGHVHKGKEAVIAGFCDAHHDHESEIKKCQGCYGDWQPKMGSYETK